MGIMSNILHWEFTDFIKGFFIRFNNEKIGFYGVGWYIINIAKGNAI